MLSVLDNEPIHSFFLLTGGSFFHILDLESLSLLCTI
jgi:hypothetical protein